MSVHRKTLVTIAIALLPIIAGCRPSAPSPSAPSPTLPRPTAPSPTAPGPTATLASIGDFPIGTFTNPIAAVTWEFRADGTYSAQGSDGGENGIFTVTGDQIALKGDFCGETTGTYAWTYDGQGLAFKPLDDECAFRLSVIVSGRWDWSDLADAQPTTTPYPLPTLAEEGPIPVIVDDDGSPDGVIALLFFLRNPLYDVEAVTVSSGEAHPQLFAHNIAQILAAFDRADIPVGFGKATPLQGDNAFPEPWRHASDAFWDIPLPQAPNPTEPRPAAELVVETLSNSTRPTMVFVTGPLTNVAEALRLDSGIGEHIRGIYVMGGSIYVPGNIESAWPAIHNSAAEWNIWVDPLAAGEVFASGLPLHVVPLDATNQVAWTEADERAWVSSAVPEALLAGELLEMMLRSQSADAAYVWDLVAAVISTDPRLCPEVQLALDVAADPGPEQGRTIVEEPPSNAWVCLNPDSAQIKARAASILSR